MFIVNASLINFTTILISVNDFYGINIKNFTIKNGDISLCIDSYNVNNNFITFFLKSKVDIKRKTVINYDNSSCEVNYFRLYSSEEFNNKYYTDENLGNFYTKDHTEFLLWSPIATYVNLLIYESGDPKNNDKPKKYKMTEHNGLWKIKLKGNLKGYFYTYEIKIHSRITEAVDPYAKAVGINGFRAAIIDLNDTDPKGFHKDFAPSLDNFTDAIIYELSIRDISMHPDSGIKNKGKFLGLSEENTQSSKGISTGLSHIKELGVTHVQIMPMFDFSWMSIDEKNPYRYNWGYDPLNYNVPEGSYSTDPYFPICRIHELKKMIQLLHRNNICVVMDVVYNHLYSLMENNFNKIFPGYYFRYDNEGNPSDGSGCGNDTASERPMMRKFIIDSVKYWATEYHLDGFRFDLMGLHDITTINTIREELNKISKSIMVYGEGWVLNTMLSNDKRANINNTDLLPTIGLFNDVIRDNLKGSVFFSSDRGFINGKDNLESVIRYCITGCTYNMDINSRGMFLSPEKTINYVACHDNYTLWDKLQLTNNDYNVEDMKAIYKMADSIILTSQGIPFIFSGAEFCRTKNGISNSYNSTDAINRIDWHRKSLFIDIFEYYKGMIELRKAHPAFRMNSLQDIKAHMYFLRDVPRNCVAFILKDHANDDIWKDILVIYNANRYDLRVKVPNDTWSVVVNKYVSGTEILDCIEGNELPVQGLSVNVLFNA